MQLLPNAKLQFLDQNGAPLAGGSVYYYAPGTTNPLPTYQDKAGTIQNTNPVVLDSRGQAVVWGSGTYRQVVCDASGVTLWDQVITDASTGLIQGQMVDEVFNAGTDFAAGTSTTITLANAYGSAPNISVVMDGIEQSPSTYSLAGKTLTFNAAIPFGISQVWVKGGIKLPVNVPAVGSVIDSSVASGNRLYNRICNTVDVTDPAFGADPTGVKDSSAAIQAAIDYVCKFTWQGTTRATELNAAGGTVYFPRGNYQITKKIRLAPHLRMVGDGPSDDFASRSGSGGTGTGGKYSLGSAIFANISNFNSYAIDTSPYNSTGTRTDDRLQNGGDSYSGQYTQVAGVCIENMTFYGNWTCKGLNLAGAELVRLKNVYLKGFTVGIRNSAIWYGSFDNVRIMSNYRGILNWQSVTDLVMTNVNVAASVDGVTYNPASSGRDPGDPPPVSDLTQAMIDMNTGILNYYGNIEALNVAVENFPQCFLSLNAVDSYRGVYVEGCTGVVLRIQGSDQQNGYFEFDTINPNTGDMIWASNARLTVEARNHNYTQGNFGKLYNFLNSSGQQQFVPVLRGLYENSSDTVSAQFVRNIADDYREGGWTPVLAFGGVAAGTQTVSTGKWIRNGRMVTAKFSIRIPTLSGATGSASITGLPFLPENIDGTDFMGGLVLFCFNAPVGMLTQVQPGVAGLYLTNNAGSILTQSGFSSGCDIRGYVVYMVQNGN